MFKSKNVHTLHTFTQTAPFGLRFRGSIVISTGRKMHALSFWLCDKQLFIATNLLVLLLFSLFLLFEVQNNISSLWSRDQCAFRLGEWSQIDEYQFRRFLQVLISFNVIKITSWILCLLNNTCAFPPFNRMDSSWW